MNCFLENLIMKKFMLPLLCHAAILSVSAGDMSPIEEMGPALQQVDPVMQQVDDSMQMVAPQAMQMGTQPMAFDADPMMEGPMDLPVDQMPMQTMVPAQPMMEEVPQVAPAQ
jgi:hypothetical protein